MSAKLPAIPKKNSHSSTDSRGKNKKLSLVKAEQPAAESKKVHLEFPYDDLELLYEYTLKELGITDPFK